MTQNSETNSDTIIDLDADQVVENVEPHSEKPPPATVRKNSVKRNWMYGGVALLAGAVAGGWFYKDVLSDYFPSDQMRSLADRVAILDSSNAALREQVLKVDKLSAQMKSDIDSMEAKDSELAGLAETAQQSQTVATDKIAALELNLVDIKKSVEELAARPVVTTDGSAVPADASIIATLNQRIESLEKDLASLKAQPAEAADNRAVLSQGLSDLKAKIAAGTGYRDEYERINRMVPAAAGLDVLERHAALGLPDTKGLASELRGIIGYLPKPVVPEPVAADQSWWSGITDSLSDLITIKVEGETDWPATTEAAAALAESGDLPQAIEYMSKPEGAKPGGVQQWIDRANNRIALETALKQVEEAVLRVIAAKG